MKQPTIWESASRPLFVRTVWLESSELRHARQRYFLWDYETRQPLERLNSAINPLQTKRTDTLQHSISLKLNDYTDFEGEPEVFLIGSAKVKLHEPFKLGTNKKTTPLKSRRRSSLLQRKYPSYDSYQFAHSKHINSRSSDISESYSRRNSLTQPQQTTETAEELLAARVLNWLDLAGKEEFVKNLQDLKNMEVKLSKTAKLRQDAIKRYNTKAPDSLKSKPHKTKLYQRAATAVAHTSPEAIKHITIIFNKEGQPIRFNRPAKNTEVFCAFANKPNSTRRLAGLSVASAGLLHTSVEKSVQKKPNVKLKTQTKQANKSAPACRRLDTVADLTNSTLQKRLHEQPLAGSCNNLHNSKKQLHIFMPSLPKKELARSVYGTEDGMSELSHHFSELCRI